MKKFFKKYGLGLTLTIAYFQLEFYRLVWWIWPESATVKVNWFIDRCALEEGITPLWYVKGISEHILWVCVLLCFANLALKISRKAFIIISIFGIYHLADFIMYFIDFSQSRWLYTLLLVVNVTALIAVFWPIKEKAKVVSME